MEWQVFTLIDKHKKFHYTLDYLGRFLKNQNKLYEKVQIWRTTGDNLLKWDIITCIENM